MGWQEQFRQALGLFRRERSAGDPEDESQRDLFYALKYGLTPETLAAFFDLRRQFQRVRENEAARRRPKPIQGVAHGTQAPQVGHATGTVTAPKPVDRWLTFGAVVVGLVLWLVAKTPATVAIAGAAIFGLL
ncbi:MAG TPA: hypothetical protein VN905_12430, partial [Candidatus Binatia bacterium]|nr:hypothetical protein [Candidatus Binatia bacterium]